MPSLLLFLLHCGFISREQLVTKKDAVAERRRQASCKKVSPQGERKRTLLSLHPSIFARRRRRTSKRARKGEIKREKSGNGEKVPEPREVEWGEGRKNSEIVIKMRFWNLLSSRAEKYSLRARGRSCVMYEWERWLWRRKGQCNFPTPDFCTKIFSTFMPENLF